MFGGRQDASTLTAELGFFSVFSPSSFMCFICGLECTHMNTSNSANVFHLRSRVGGVVAVGYLDASVSPRQSPAWPCCIYSFWGQKQFYSQSRLTAAHVALEATKSHREKMKFKVSYYIHSQIFTPADQPHRISFKKNPHI